MSIKQKIWEHLDKNGDITDSDLAKIYGKEPNFYTAEVYKKEWENLKWCLKNYNFHLDKTTEIIKIKRRYFARNKQMKEEYGPSFMTIPKVYADYINKTRK